MVTKVVVIGQRNMGKRIEIDRDQPAIYEAACAQAAEREEQAVAEAQLQAMMRITPVVRPTRHR
jgi:hypothetical protein